MTQLERHKDEELADRESDELAVSFHWNRNTGDLNVLVDGELGLSFAVETVPEQGPTAPPLHTPAHPASPDTQRRFRRLAHKTVQRLRLANDDGTPTLWWAVVNLYAPAIGVISIIVFAILKQ